MAMPATQQTDRRGAFIGALKALPQYKGWSDDEIQKNLSEVLSSEDENRRSGFLGALSKIPQYKGWKPEEIAGNVQEVFTVQAEAQAPEQSLALLTPELEAELKKFPRRDEAELARQYREAGTPRQPGLELATPAEAAIAVPTGFGSMAVEAGKSAAHPIIAGVQKFQEGRQALQAPTSLADLLRGTADMLLGGTEAGIGSIPAMAGVNAAIGVGGESAIKTAGKITGDIASAIAPSDRAGIARNIGQRKGEEVANTGLEYGVAAMFGKPVLIGIGLSQLTDAVTREIMSDSKLSDEDKNRIAGLASNIAFFTGAIGAHAIPKAFGKPGKVDPNQIREAGENIRQAKPEDVKKIEEIVSRFEEVRPSGEPGPAPILTAGKPPEPAGLAEQEAQIIAQQEIGAQAPSKIIKPAGEVTRTGAVQREIPEVPAPGVAPLAKPIPAVEEKTGPQTSADFTQRSLEAIAAKKKGKAGEVQRGVGTAETGDLPPLPKSPSVQVKKDSPGTYRLYYRGTTNPLEEFSDQTFKSPNQARAFYNDVLSGKRPRPTPKAPEPVRAPEPEPPAPVVPSLEELSQRAAESKAASLGKTRKQDVEQAALDYQRNRDAFGEDSEATKRSEKRYRELIDKYEKDHPAEGEEPAAAAEPVEPKPPIPAAPKAEPLPEFTRSEEAIYFGRQNPERIPELEARAKEADADFYRFQKENKLDEARQASIRAQLAREAVEFAQDPNRQTPYEKLKGLPAGSEKPGKPITQSEIDKMFRGAKGLSLDDAVKNITEAGLKFVGKMGGDIVAQLPDSKGRIALSVKDATPENIANEIKAQKGRSETGLQGIDPKPDYDPAKLDPEKLRKFQTLLDEAGVNIKVTGPKGETLSKTSIQGAIEDWKTDNGKEFSWRAQALFKALDEAYSTGIIEIRPSAGDPHVEVKTDDLLGTAKPRPKPGEAAYEVRPGEQANMFKGRGEQAYQAKVPTDVKPRETKGTEGTPLFEKPKAEEAGLFEAKEQPAQPGRDVSALKEKIDKLTNGDLYRIAGPKNADLRRDLLQEITGKKVPKSEAGVNRLRDAVAELAGLDPSKLAPVEMERGIAEWLKGEKEQAPKLRRLNYGDIGVVNQLPEAEIREAAKPVIDALKNLEDVSGKDQAGIPNRGGSVYDELLEGKFTPRQLAAARWVLQQDRANVSLLRSLEAANVVEAEPTPSPKQPWEMTGEEYAGDVSRRSKGARGFERYEQKIKEHKRAVESALSEGKPVPESVLKDYPDLKEKVGKGEPRKTGTGGKPLAMLGANIIGQSVIANSDLSDEDKQKYGTLINLATFAGAGVALGKSASGTAIRGVINRAKTEWLAKGTRSSFFKNWFGDWEKDPASASKVVDDQGRPLKVYSGHSNTPLYKNFDPKKGTAGGFYASEDPAVASGYAMGKFGVKEYYENANQYRIKGANGEYNKKVWQVELTPEQKAKLEAMKTQVDENGERVYELAQMDDYIKSNRDYDKDARRWGYRGGSDNLQNIWEFYEQMGYNIAYAKEGTAPFFERQAKNRFEEVLDDLGIEWQAHDWHQPGLMSVYLDIRNPLDADKPFPPALLSALKDKAKHERNVSTDEMLSRHWTKDYPLKEWVKDIEEGSEGWTTQVPKKALPILREFGYDGIKERGAKGSELPRDQRRINWIAFEPEQIKSATANRGTFEPTEKNMLAMSGLSIAGSAATEMSSLSDEDKKRLKLLFGITGAIGIVTAAGGQIPGFYSKLSKFISEKMPKAMTAEAFKNFISKGEVKSEELKWTGINDFIESIKGRPVTKAEVEQYLKANQVIVQEVVKGGPGKDPIPFEGWTDAEIRRHYEQLTGEKPPATMPIEEVKRRASEIEDNEMIFNGIDKPTETKYSNYQLPGSKEGSYRELLLTLPTRVQKAKIVQGSDGLWYAEFADGKRSPYGAETREAVQGEIDASIKRANRGEPTSTENTFRGGHFDEPNVLAHIRFNEREIDGKRTLFLEEIQSDWHQKGRKEGYKGEWTVTDASGKREFGRFKTESESDAFVKANRPQGEIWRVKQGDIPDAPFKSTWQELAFRRMVKYAVDNGYDRIAWTKGTQQVDRYNKALRQKVDKIYAIRGKDKATVLAFKNEQNVFNHLVPLEGTTTIAGKEVSLDDVVGKNIAEKIRTGEKEQNFEGQDLTIGGEGMKGFYDKILVDYANKLGKQWGARVEEVKMPLKTPGEQLASEINAREAVGTSMERTYKELATPKLTPVHSLPITPEMKKSVLEKGQPLFLQGLAAGSYLSIDAIPGLSDEDKKRLKGILGPITIAAIAGPALVKLSPKALGALKEIESSVAKKALTGKQAVKEISSQVKDYLATEGKNLSESERAEIGKIADPIELAKAVSKATTEPKHLEGVASPPKEAEQPLPPRKEIAGDLGVPRLYTDPYGKIINTFEPNKRGVMISEKFAKDVSTYKDLGKFEAGKLSTTDYLRATEKMEGVTNGVFRKEVVRPIEEANFDATKEIHDVNMEFQGVLKKNRIKKSSPSSERIFQKIEGRLAEKLDHNEQVVADWLKDKYNTLIDRLNKERAQVNLKPVHKRDHYITHFQELAWYEEFFGSLSDSRVPSEVLKAVEFTKPNNPFFRFMLERKGGKYTEDAVSAFEIYYRPAINNIHKTVPLTTARAYVKHLPPNASRYFTDWLNEGVANKSTTLDRSMPDWFNRGLNVVATRIGKNLILGNFQVLATQLSSMPQSFAEAGIRNALKGIGSTLTPAGWNFAEKHSKILQLREFEGLEDVNPSRFHALEKLSAWHIEAADRMMVRMSFNAGMKKALAEGKSFDEAVQLADDFAQKTQAAYGRMFKSPIMRNRTISGTIGQFQVYTNNLMNYVVYDAFSKRGGEGNMRVVGKLATLLGGALAVNQVYDQLGLPSPWSPSTFVPFWNAVTKLIFTESDRDIQEAVGSSGKFGAPAAIQTVKDVGVGAYRVGGGLIHGDQKQVDRGFALLLKNVPVLAMPYGGRQVAKTLEGAKAISEGGVYNASGKKLFEIEGLDEQLKTIIFGRYGSTAAQEYLKQEEQNRATFTKPKAKSNTRRSK